MTAPFNSPPHETWPFEVATLDQLIDLKEGKIVASDAGATIPGITEENVASFLMDLVVAVALGLLEPDAFIVGIQAAAVTAEIVAHHLPEMIGLLWLQHRNSDATVSVDEQERLMSLTKALCEQDKWVTKERFKEVLEAEALEQFGLIPSAALFKQKEVKVNTKLFYTQTKFNLFRECSEGYAKLLDLLLQSRFQDPSVDNFRTAEEDMKAIMGGFNLDPFRVLDVIIDAFSLNTKAVIYTRFIRHFQPNLIQNNLGLRFQRSHEAGKGASLSLCLVTAGLIKDQQVTLGAILGHTEPSDADLKALAADSSSRFRQAVDKIGVISLTAAVQPKPEAKRMGMNQPEQMRPFTAQTMDLDAIKILRTANSGLKATSQQLPLLEALILVGSWENAKVLIKHLEAVNVEPMEFENVAKALCKTIRKQVEPMARALLPQGLDGPSILDEKLPTGKPSYLSRGLKEMLDVLDVHLYNDQKLWGYLCHLMRHVIQYNLYHLNHKLPDTDLEELEWAEDYFVGALMVSAPLFGPASCAAGIWATLNLYPYSQRAKFYNLWKEQTEKILLTKAQSKLAASEVKKVLRRVHSTGSDHSKRALNRTFAHFTTKLVDAGPFSTLATIISQVEAYGGTLIDPILDVLRQLSPLGFDTLTYLFIEGLKSDKRQKIKFDGINTADWLKALSSFIAGTCKRYYQHINITVICQCMSQKLQDFKTHEVLLLADLIKSMSCIEAVSNISEAQAEACAGGPILRTEVIYFAAQKAHKHLSKTVHALSNALQQASPDYNGAGNFIVLLYKVIEELQRTADPTSPIPEAKDVKYSAQQVDSCALLFLQLLDFFKTALSSEQYTALMPSITDLVEKFHFRPQTALTVHRTTLGKISMPLLPHSEDGEIANEPAASEKAPSATGKAEAVEKPVEDGTAWQEMAATVKNIFPKSSWEYIIPDFVLMFYSLSYSDIHFPEARYKSEEAAMTSTISGKQQQVEVAKYNESNARRQTEENKRRGIDEIVHPPDGVDIPTTEREIQRLQEAVRKIPAEAKKQAGHVKEVRKRLLRLKDVVASQQKQSRKTANSIMDICIMPRVTVSAEDAMYCAAFIEKMHQLDMPAFHTLDLILMLMKGMMPMLMIATDFESHNIGMFLNAVLLLLKKWEDGKVYNAQCAGKFGFRSNPNEPDTISHALYQRFVSTKMEAMLLNFFLDHLKSTDYSRIKNSLDVLSKTIKVFPKAETSATSLKQAAWDIVQRGESGVEKREDIKNRAKNYHFMIAAEMKNKFRFTSTSAQSTKTASTAKPSTKPPAKPSNVPKPAAKPEPVAKPSTTVATASQGAVGKVTQEPANGAKRPRQTIPSQAEEAKQKTLIPPVTSSLRADAPEFRPQAAEKDSSRPKVSPSDHSQAGPSAPAAPPNGPPVAQQRKDAVSAPAPAKQPPKDTKAVAPRPEAVAEGKGSSTARAKEAKKPDTRRLDPPAERASLHPDSREGKRDAGDRKRDAPERRRDVPEDKSSAVEKRREVPEVRRPASERERGEFRRADSRRDASVGRRDVPDSRKDSHERREPRDVFQGMPRKEILEKRQELFEKQVSLERRREGSEGKRRSDSEEGGKRQREEPHPESAVPSKRPRKDRREPPAPSKPSKEPAVPSKPSKDPAAGSKRKADSDEKKTSGEKRHREEPPENAVSSKRPKKDRHEAPEEKPEKSKTRHDSKAAAKAAEEKAREDALKAFKQQPPASPVSRPQSPKPAAPQAEAAPPAPESATKSSRAPAKQRGLFGEAMRGIVAKPAGAAPLSPARERKARKAKATEEAEDAPPPKRPRAAEAPRPSSPKTRSKDEEAEAAKASKGKDKKRAKRSKKEKKEKKDKKK